MDKSEPERRSRKRLGILGMIFICVIINYVDRSCISVAAPVLTEELRIDSVKMGIIFSAFSWTYAALQVPGGVVVDVNPETGRASAIERVVLRMES